MAKLEEGVTGHYAAYDVLANIRRGLEASGHDPDHIEPDVLKPVDEFHIGGASATISLVERLHIREGSDLLDIGCGIGGPARTMALATGAHVTGIDLTPAYVEAAKALSAMVGLGERVRFLVASATALPFPDAAFDIATMLHVGMNIPDKQAVFREAARVLRPGGIFAVYDAMRTGEGGPDYPVPWAETSSLSFLERPEVYRTGAAACGLRQDSEDNRRSIALEFFARLREQAVSETPAPLGLHLLMGPTVKQKTAHMVAAISAGQIAPIQMIFRKA